MLKLGVISDTHGLLRPEALRALEGSQVIIHAGDVGDESILEALEKIAPLHAIRGNVDTAAWARRLPETLEVQVGEARIWVLHDRHDLALDPVKEGFQAVITGHSHKPGIEQQNGVLYLNPGSAGPRRFRLPVTVALCAVNGKTMHAEIVDLGV